MHGLFTKYILLNIQSYHFSHPGEFKQNMIGKIAETDARPSQVDQLAVVTARPRLGT